LSILESLLCTFVEFSVFHHNAPNNFEKNGLLSGILIPRGCF